MSDFNKASWQIDGNHARLNMTFSKVDRESRTVSGFATVDSLDKQADLVPADTALKAFNQFRGNLREMHQPIAAGRVLDFTQEACYDPGTEKMYSGVYVTAYVSKGAQDTWEKVLDGTLTGFSIGGSINDSENVYDSANKSMVRVIKDMDLYELSLVDNPANPLANIVSVVKMYTENDEQMAKGIAVDVSTENIFWCPKDEYAKTVKSEEASCSQCGNKMENIGWVEAGDGMIEKVAALVDQHINSGTQKRNDEGGLDVSGEAKETVAVAAEATVEKAVETAAEVSEVAGDEVVEKAAEAEAEVVDEQPDFLKAIEDLKSFVTKSIDEAIAAQNESVQSKLEEVTKSWAAQNITLENKVSEVTEYFNSLKDGTFASDKADEVVKSLSTLTEQVKALSDSTAFKKSGDLGGESVAKKSNNIWKGSFLGIDELTQ